MSSKTMRRIGAIQRQILTLLYAGVAFGLSQSPKKQIQIVFEDLPEELAKNRVFALEYGVHRLVKDRLLGIRKCGHGIYEAYLTKEGKEVAYQFDLESIVIRKPKKWDKKWRIVIFDIPENKKKKREIFRYHLRRLGFREIQRSSFCYPHDSATELYKIASGLGIEKHIVYMVVDEISNDKELKLFFKV